MEKETHYLAIKKFSNPTVEQIRYCLERVREDDIKEYYDSYQSGSLVSYVIHELPTLEIVHSSDINVYYSNTSICKCHTDIVIERRSREWARNYMGYHKEERCYVFTGQRRLMEQFLELTASLFKKGEVETAFVQPRPIQIPLEGLNPGLDYEQFAAYIENWDCILFLLPKLHDPLAMDDVASSKKVSSDQMYGPASYGLLVEASTSSSIQQKTPRSVSRDRAVAVTKEGLGKNTTASLQGDMGRYTLRQRRPSIKYN